MKKKYKVTSIPSELPKARNGGSTPEEPQYDINFPVNQPMGPPTEAQYNEQLYTPAYLDKLYNREYTGDFESDNIYDNMYLDSMTGKPLQCPEGYEAYKGECIPTAQAIELYEKERNKYWDDYEKKTALKNQQRNVEWKARLQEIERKKGKDYMTLYNATKKTDKVYPQHENVHWRTLNKQVPVYNEEGSVKTDDKGNPVTESALSQYKKTHYVQKEKDGTYSMWPKIIMQQRIINNGFFNNEFEEYWGLDPKQVKEQFGELQDAARKDYEYRMLDGIFKKAVDQGKPLDEVIENLPSKWGITKNLKSQFKGKVEDIIDTQYKDLMTGWKEEYDKIMKENAYDPDKDFNWGDTDEEYTVETPGMIFGDLWPNEHKEWRISKDPEIKYAYWWANQADTEEEREERRNQVNNILNTTYVDDSNDELFYRSTNATDLINDADEKADEDFYQNQMEFEEQNPHLIATERLTRYRDFPRELRTAQRNAENAEQAIAYNKGQQIAALNELTGASESKAKYMRDSIYGAGQGNLMDHNLKRWWDAGGMGDGTTGKIKTLKNYFDSRNNPTDLNKAFGVNSIVNEYGENVFEANPWIGERFFGNEVFYDHLWNKPEYAKYRTDYIPENTTGDMSWYNYLWDYASNPGDALYYALSPESMHPDKYGNLSYNQRQEFEEGDVLRERETGQMGYNDAGTATYGDMWNMMKNPMFSNTGIPQAAMVMKYFNSLNPANWVDKIGRSDNKWETASNLGYNAALDAATIASFIPSGGTSAAVTLPWRAGKIGLDAYNKLNKFNKAQYIMGQGFKALNPFRYMSYYGKNAPLIDPIGKWGTKLVEKNLQYMTPAFALDAVRPGGYLPNAYTDFSQGNFGSGLGNTAMGLFGLQAGYGLGARGLHALRTGDFSPHLRGSFPAGTQYARNAEQFRHATGLQTPGSRFTMRGTVSNPKPGEITDFGKNYYKSLYKQVHPDIKGGSTQSSQLLGDMYTGKGYQYIPFNANMQSGVIAPKYQFGRWSYGPNVFQPKTVEEMLLLQKTGKLPISNTYQKPTKFISSSSTEKGSNKSDTKKNKRKFKLFGKNKRIEGYKEGGLVKANKGCISRPSKKYSGIYNDFFKGRPTPYRGKGYKDALRFMNMGYWGTMDDLAKVMLPVKMNPMQLMTLGHPIEEVGPFTGSPLNFVPGYGSKLPSQADYESFLNTPYPDTENANYWMNMGNSLDHFRSTGFFDPTTVNLGSKLGIFPPNYEIANEGFMNHKNHGIYAMEYSPTNAEARISEMNNGLYNIENDKALGLSMTDSGISSIKRRLPFSNRYVNVDLDKLRNDEFQWSTQGSYFQSLVERYGYATAYAMLLGALGFDTPQEKLDDYINSPLKDFNNDIRNVSKDGPLGKAISESRKGIRNTLKKDKKQKGGSVELPKANKGLCLPKPSNKPFNLGKTNYNYNYSKPSGLNMAYPFQMSTYTLPSYVSSLRNALGPLMGNSAITGDQAMEFVAPEIEELQNVDPDLYSKVQGTLSADDFPNQFFSTSNIGTFKDQSKISTEQLKGSILKEPQGNFKWPLLENSLISEFGTMPKSISFSDMQRLTDSALTSFYKGRYMFSNSQPYDDGLFYKLPDGPNKTATGLGFINHREMRTDGIYSPTVDSDLFYRTYPHIVQEDAKIMDPIEDLKLQQSVLSGTNENISNEKALMRHRNPKETLSHTRSFIDPSEPDTSYLIEFQSDPFQGLDKHAWKKNERDIKNIRKKIEELKSKKDTTEYNKEWIDKTKDWTEAEFEKNYRKQRSFETLRDWEQGTLGEAASMNFNDPIDPVSYDSYKLTGSLQSTAAVRENKIKTLENEILDLENKIVAAQGTGAQKNRSLLFDKNWESITLQKHFEQAANQGQTKVRIPTEETAVKIQGYQKENQYVTPEGGIDFENMDPATQMDSFEDWMGGETIYDYRKGHKTVLAKYKKIPKFLKKAFGYNKKDVRIVTDRFGNKWYEVDIPKSFLEGSGQIIHQEGGIVTELDQNQIDEYAKNGWIIEDV